MSTLIGKIIIATPQLDFSNFKEAILLIVEDDNKGSMGIVLNKLSNYSTDEFFESLKLKNNLKYTDKPINIYEGGPIQQESGFVVHRTCESQKWKTTIHQSQDLSVTVSKDIMRAISKEQGPKDYIITLGCAGWEKGQLQEEINDNLWLVAPLNSDIIFKTPIQQRYQKTAESIGIKQICLLSTEVGHA